MLTLKVNLDLHNKRLACLSYNRTYIEGFDITDISELFNVSVSKNKKGHDLQFTVKALIWIAAALIIFVLAQQITNFTSSRTGEEGDSDRQRMGHRRDTGYAARSKFVRLTIYMLREDNAPDHCARETQANLAGQQSAPSIPGQQYHLT
ncbi:hypothetical protein PoB_005083700 [Plakobranchus ocellatus]|uniref:Uncharacterized protein n=1 Tax=Plakobranchus ocellatus TaxID=259542 RepID=A0AAV4BZ58_9GAST|nr:hypothetical protein PoB_005083700 [Plakobranchus ocellatus]